MGYGGCLLQQGYDLGLCERRAGVPRKANGEADPFGGSLSAHLTLGPCVTDSKQNYRVSIQEKQKKQSRKGSNRGWSSECTVPNPKKTDTAGEWLYF